MDAEPSCVADGCPSPRLDRAFVVHGGEVVAIPCGRNTCPYCRRRNVQVTAAKMALNQSLTDRPVSHAVLSTTRDWVDEATLREGWAQMARRVRREVCAEARYAWFREWTEGKRDGIRRTHYHSTWALDSDEQGQAVACISNEVWARLAGAWSKRAHGVQRVWDSGGLARYVAGLVGHHLKANQAPPPGWSGRRYGVSRGFYATDSRELDRQAKAVVRDDRLRWRLERELVGDPGWGDPDAPIAFEIFDEVLTERLEAARSRPAPKVVRLPRGWSW